MKVNIYYGGRGNVDDPTLFVINKLQEVLGELKVDVERYNLFDMKNQITALSQTVTEADAVVLATTVEWLGMGGYMQTFLDSCWLYADKSKLSSVYMFPVVMSKTYGEKEVSLVLVNSWEMLGGQAEAGISAYVEDNTAFEFNGKYVEMIERYAENIYRSVSQKRVAFPSSNQYIKNNVLKEIVNFTPQESEQLSKYASDDEFVMTQKKDIESLASIYKELLTDQENGGDDYYLDVFRNNYVSTPGYNCKYSFIVSDKGKNFVIDIKDGKLSAGWGEAMDAEVIAKMTRDVFDEIVGGKITFHRAFLTGYMTAKGNLKNLRMLDDIFSFSS